MTVVAPATSFSTLAGVSASALPVTDAAFPEPLRWGAGESSKEYSLSSLTLVKPEADVVAAVTKAVQADPLIGAHVTADAASGQRVFSMDRPLWFAGATIGGKFQGFGAVGPLASAFDRLVVREATLPCVRRVLAALGAATATRGVRVAFDAPPGQGASTQLLTLAAIALVEAGGRDVVLHKGPGPLSRDERWRDPSPSFLHISPGGGAKTTYNTPSALAAAGLNKPSTVLVYDPNAWAQCDVASLFSRASMVAVVGPCHAEWGWADHARATRIPVPPLAPREYAAVAKAVWRGQPTAESLARWVEDFGLSLRAPGYAYAMAAAGELLMLHARREGGEGGEGTLVVGDALAHALRASEDRSLKPEAAALFRVVRDAETGANPRCVFASAQARRWVECRAREFAGYSRDTVYWERYTAQDRLAEARKYRQRRDLVVSEWAAAQSDEPWAARAVRAIRSLF